MEGGGGGTTFVRPFKKAMAAHTHTDGADGEERDSFRPTFFARPPRTKRRRRKNNK